MYRKYMLAWGPILIALCLFGLVGPGVAAATQSRQIKHLGSTPFTPEELAWLKDHPTLTFSVPTKAPPLYYKDERGDLVGLHIDYVRLLAKRIGIEIEVKGHATWNDAIEAAKKHIVDGIPNADATEDRKPYLNFTDSYATLPQVIVTRGDYDLIRRFDDVSGKRIAVKRSSSRVYLLKDQYPESEIVEVDHLTAGLDFLVANKVEAVYADLAQIDTLLTNKFYTNLKYAVVAETPPVGLARVGIRNDDPMLLQIFNKAIASLAREEHLAIKQRWLPISKPGFKKKIELTAAERAWLAAHPVIRVHNEMNWPPFNYNENGQPKGYSIAYMNLLAQRLGIAVEYTSGPNWAEFLDMLKAKQLDVMLNIVNTSDRRTYIDFTDDYIHTLTGIYVHQDSPDITTLKELEGKTVSVPKGFYHEELLKRHYPMINLYLVNDNLAALEAVILGKADAALSELAVTHHLIMEHSIAGLKLSGKVADSRFDNVLNIGVRKDWPLLRDILQKAMRSITYGETSRLKQQWLPVQVSEKTTGVVLTEEERDWLQQHPVLRLGYDIDWPPIEFADADGNYQGIAAEYVKIVSESLGVTIEPVAPQSWQDTMAAAKAGELDILAALTPTHQRRAYLEFTTPYLRLPLVIVTGLDYSYISDISALAGKTVAVVSNYASHGFLTNNHPELDLALVIDAEEGLRAVRRGNADAFVGSLAAVSYIIGREGIPGLKISGETPYSYRSAMAVPQDKAVLAGILQKALDAIPEQRRTEILNRWVSVKYERGFDYSLLWRVVGAAVVVLIAILYWNRRLRSEIGQRQRAEIQLENQKDLLEVILENIDQAVALYDADRRIIAWNRHFPSAVNLSEENFIYKGRSVYDIGYELAKRGVYGAGDPHELATERVETLWSGQGVPVISFGDERNFSVHSKALPDGGLVIAFSDITEHKRYEAKLLEAKETAEALNRELAFSKFSFDNAPDAIMWLRADTAALVYVNKQVCELLGYSHEEMLRQSAFDFDPIHTREAWPAFRTEMRRQTQMTFESIWRRRDGSEFPVEIAAKTLNYRGEEYFIAFIRDIREQKQFQDELKNARDDAEAATETATRLLAETRRKNAELEIINRVGQALNEQLDLDKMVTLVGDTLFEAMRPNIVYIAILDESNQAIDFPYFRAGGQRVSRKPLKIGEGLTSTIINTSEALLCANMQEQLDRGVVLDPDTAPSESFAGVPILSGKKALGVLSIQHLEPDRFTAADIRTLNTIASNLGIALENAHLYAEAQDARMAAEAANQAKSVFLGNMSHEIRTPMNAILGYSQIMQHDTTLTTDQKKNLGIINRSGDHLLALINDVLEMSKIEAGRIDLNPAPFDLLALMDDLELMFRVRTGEKGLDFFVEKKANLPRFVEADEGKVRQVLINLLGNAVKFTQAGEIRLQAGYGDEDLSAPQPPGGDIYIAFNVADTGCGVPKDQQEAIFGAFEQTESGRMSEGGTGLGLSISRQYAQLMGGDLTISSQPGQGSLFRFTFSARVAAAAAVLTDQTDQRTIMHLKDGQAPPRILVVDDREYNVDILTKMLVRVGYQVRPASNGQEAMDLYADWRPQVVLMDIRMPVMDGVEATRRIRTFEEECKMQGEDEAGCRATIIAVSASALENQRKEIMQPGLADAFISKPFKEAEVLESLRKYLKVAYLYDESVPSEIEEAGDPDPTAVTLARERLPAGLLDDLREATINLEVDRLKGLVAQVKAHDHQFADYVRQLVDRYDFDTLGNLLDIAK